MHGNGTMIWSNGNRYDGTWEDGFPRGNGNFKWPDGSLYVGIWTKDGKDQNGTYYPAGSPSENLDWDPQQVFLEDLKDAKICTGENLSILPSQKMPNWSAMAKRSEGRQRRMVDRKSKNFSYGSDITDVSIAGEGDSKVEDVVRSPNPENSDIRLSRPQFKKVMKKQGQTISKGHKNYDLMLNLQLGIRY